ncbi:hypothetical protein [Nostoc sp. PA-18-2419]|nr:hypothetical protein [Nostoc sp. PA-18-2419]
MTDALSDRSPIFLRGNLSNRAIAGSVSKAYRRYRQIIANNLWLH